MSRPCTSTIRTTRSELSLQITSSDRRKGRPSGRPFCFWSIGCTACCAVSQTAAPTPDRHWRATEGRRKQKLAATIDAMLPLFCRRTLAFYSDAVCRCADLAVAASNMRKGLPAPDGCIATLATAHDFITATGDASFFNKASVPMIYDRSVDRAELKIWMLGALADETAAVAKRKALSAFHAG